MKPITSQRTASILKLTFLFVLLFFIIDGCKKDSSPTSPVGTPTIPSVAGHWVGGGSYFDQGVGKRLNVTWLFDFMQQQFYTTQWDSAFTGNITSTYTDAGTPYSGWSDIWGVKGKVTTSRQVTLTDTSGVAVKGSQSIVLTPSYFFTYTGITLSANGDTLSYSGPSPELETFVLVKQ